MLKFVTKALISTFALTASASAFALNEVSYVGLDGLAQPCQVNVIYKDSGKFDGLYMKTNARVGVLVGEKDVGFSADGIMGELGSLAVLGNTTLRTRIPTYAAENLFTLIGGGYDSLVSVSYSQFWIGVPAATESGSCNGLVRTK